MTWETWIKQLEQIICRPIDFDPDSSEEFDAHTAFVANNTPEQHARAMQSL